MIFVCFYYNSESTTCLLSLVRTNNSWTALTRRCFKVRYYESRNPRGREREEREGERGEAGRRTVRRKERGGERRKRRGERREEDRTEDKTEREGRERRRGSAAQGGTAAVPRPPEPKQPQRIPGDLRHSNIHRHQAWKKMLRRMARSLARILEHVA